jgi:hypothetical protein
VRKGEPSVTRLELVIQLTWDFCCKKYLNFFAAFAPLRDNKPFNVIFFDVGNLK